MDAGPTDVYMIVCPFAHSTEECTGLEVLAININRLMNFYISVIKTVEKNQNTVLAVGNQPGYYDRECVKSLMARAKKLGNRFLEYRKIDDIVCKVRNPGKVCVQGEAAYGCAAGDGVELCEKFGLEPQALVLNLRGSFAYVNRELPVSKEKVRSELKADSDEFKEMDFILELEDEGTMTPEKLAAYEKVLVAPQKSFADYWWRITRTASVSPRNLDVIRAVIEKNADHMADKSEVVKRLMDGHQDPSWLRLL